MPIYAGPMIDAHMHLWDTALDRHPWLRPSGSTALTGLDALRRPFLPDDYKVARGAHDVVATVHIEAVWDPVMGTTRHLVVIRQERPAERVEAG